MIMRNVSLIGAIIILAILVNYFLMDITLSR